MFVGGTFAVIVPTPNGAGPWHFAIISLMMLYGVNMTNAARIPKCAVKAKQ